MNLHHTFALQDVPKLAAIGVLALTLIFGARFAAGRAAAQNERERTIRQMNLEMGRGLVTDVSEVPESTPGEGDPNFSW